MQLNLNNISPDRREVVNELAKTLIMKCGGKMKKKKMQKGDELTIEEEPENDNDTKTRSHFESIFTMIDDINKIREVYDLPSIERDENFFDSTLPFEWKGKTYKIVYDNDKFTLYLSEDNGESFEEVDAVEYKIDFNKDIQKQLLQNIDLKRIIAPEHNFIEKQTIVPSKTETIKDEIIEDYDRKYNYKFTGTGWFYQEKGDNEWTSIYLNPDGTERDGMTVAKIFGRLDDFLMKKNKNKPNKSNDEMIAFFKKGGAIKNIKKETIKELDMKLKKGGSIPTNPELWKQAQAEAKKRYDKHPSAYSNLFASKWYKEKGGKWKNG